MGLRWAAAGALVLGLAAQGAGAGSLDGTRWRMREAGFVGAARLWDAEVMAFGASEFTSTESESLGFPSARYSSLQSDGRTAWSAVQANERGEEMSWSGVRTAEGMTGEYTLRKADGTEKTVRWQADLIEAGSP